MASKVRLIAADGHELAAYRVEPSGKPRGAVIVLMEIFGVNSHIRSVADRFAAEGYVAVAPAMFDRVQRDFESGYSKEEIAAGIAVMQQTHLSDAVLDVRAALDSVASNGEVAVIGFCWGGTVAFKAACDLGGLARSVAYYGGGIPWLIGSVPKCPVLLQWGETDGSIPAEKIREVTAAYPDQPSFVYPGAGHGFNCDQRPSYDAPAAALAWDRTWASCRKRRSERPRPGVRSDTFARARRWRRLTGSTPASGEATRPPGV